MKKKAAVLLALISISLIATAGIGAVSASDEPVGDVVYEPIADVALSKINLEGHAPVGAIYYGLNVMDHGIPGLAPAGGGGFMASCTTDRMQWTMKYLGLLTQGPYTTVEYPGTLTQGPYYGPDAMDHGIPGLAHAGGFMYYGPDAMDHEIPGHAPAGGFIYYGPDAMDHEIPVHALP